ncbi:amino acid adenylation domain-containing protein [Filimonas lacunae]|uniref:Amino acid adenylation domain-containing protein n=1 Tax=Filimonas lacunae TaxID=477680 RepID=A0A173MCP3_9BACT|nr:type I polyketide synthase [Filimonas lacunae]BAV05296.1 malonyl CoA-acyl carrier protein transacylase [Filimonas lacunae]SIT22141.1 amino acid adenylation domain-containing protein [Filimonas lacunae]
MSIRTERIVVPSTVVNVYELLKKQVASHPTAVAISSQGKHLTYAQLDTAVAKTAHFLTSLSDPIIGVSTTRSIDMIIRVLAVLQSGKAYMPLDPAYPASRLAQQIADSGTKYCLCDEEEEELFASLGLQRPENSRETGEQVTTDIAYILYTSGSTGKPKGVCMGHSALYNLLLWQQQHSVAGVGNKTLQFAPLSFDVSFQEIFATLISGGELVLIHDDLRLDPDSLLQLIDEKQVNRIFLPFVALQLLAETAVSSHLYPASLREVMTAGEQLKITEQVRSFFQHLPGCVLYNQYGPTECHVVTELRLEGDTAQWPALPTIGKPIDNTEIYILDEKDGLLPDGEVGELCIAGACLGKGYLNKPELTQQKFTRWKHPVKGEIAIYRSGDHARYLPDGNIEFLGRADDQVKIRGYRIELAEVEVALNVLGVAQSAVVIAREDVPGNKQLVAYLLSNGTPTTTAQVRTALADKLPEYMIPAAFVWLDTFPRTSSGKVDKKALPKPELKRPELDVAFRQPVSELEQTIAGVWEEVLQLNAIGAEDSFFELGGNSLLAQKTIIALKQHNIQLPITKLYQYPTISGIAAYLTGAIKTTQLPAYSPNKPASNGDIAIIGMSCRVPGADSAQAFWNMLLAGKEGIRFFTEEELDASIDSELKQMPGYVKARGVVNEVDAFDPAFWGLSPKLAELMDPQQRIFLEIAREALESTGYLPGIYNGLIGVYAGSGSNTYFINNVLTNPQKINQVGSLQVSTLNEKEYLSSRTAYHLNLKGPAVSVFSACSTSLLAIAQAVEALRNGQCSLALAGGVSITVPVNSGQLHQEGAMFSSDGHTRTFDAQASGTVFSDGAGVVLLRPLEQAIQAGDTIYAVIKGVGINNDGGEKTSFTAPDAAGQAGAIAAALGDAGVTPDKISYVEAHGTATPIGDPIEIEGLKLAYGNTDKKQYCAIGSVKSNIGHLTHAAGVAGIIKTAFALYHQQLPPSIHYNTPNPEIDFGNSPFYVNAALTHWKSEGERLAGVSSFGVGGTNVHVILQEYPHNSIPLLKQPDAALFSWSAKSANSAHLYAGKLKDFIAHNPQAGIGDIAYTLQTTRETLPFRQTLVATSTADAMRQLSEELPAVEVPAKAMEVAFLFPGQGAQFNNMGKAIYDREPVFQQAVDECAVLLQDIMGEDIRSIIYQLKDIYALTNTYYTQPALFVTEYALAKLWMSWGIVPAVYVGHSVGEFVAAHLAGVFSLADALQLIAARGRLISCLPQGAMLSVRAAVDTLTLPDNISVAALNAPGLCVLAGTFDAVGAYAKQLEKQGILYKQLHTSHAFHSYMMDEAVPAFKEIIARVSLQVPRKPVVSTVTGSWLTDEQATSVDYWASHMRATVQFAAAIDFAAAQQPLVMLEVGPGKTLSTLTFQIMAGKPVKAIAGLEQSEEPVNAYGGLLQALAQLWKLGVTPDWKAVYGHQLRARISLPTYAFDKKRYWVNAAPTQVSLTTTIPEETAIVNPVLQQPMNRKEILVKKIKEILENASGVTIGETEHNSSFIELGMDSLLLTQVAISLQKEFKLPISFKQLNDAFPNVEQLAKYLDKQLPASAYAVTETPVATTAATGSPLDMIMKQLGDLTRQVAALQSPGAAAVVPVKVPDIADITAAEAVELKKPFGAAARIEKQSTALNAQQQAFLQALIKSYNTKTKSSKEYTQQNRAHMADPRVVTGFKPLTKELVYSIVIHKSKGCHLWDLDGNEYIDALNGFGSSMFGFQPDFLKKAVLDQVERGYELGPQHAHAGTLAKLICEFTGFDRAALCNTGSEAVLGAMRIARTVTGRSLIVAFTGSYHGINDEVIIRGTQKLKSFPAAPGITPEAVQNMLILDYGTDKSLQIIKERAHELAAVLVEPVQSRRPEFQPVAFLKEIRKITAEAGTVLIWDEVITGFRAHPGGAQAIFGIQADVATYGKVVGGGMPIGAIAGKKQYMDALDGGFWQYGDDSVPEAGVTYFAGTFVRHPLALAAGIASLEHMKQAGPSLQENLNKLTAYLANALNKIGKQYQLPIYAVNFGSLWKLKFHEEYPYSELVFTLMRERGIHIWDGFPCFITTAHTLGDVDTIIQQFEESVKVLKAVKLIPAYATEDTQAKESVADFEVAPHPQARLGKDAEGNPAWFMADPKAPGKYLQIVEA